MKRVTSPLTIRQPCSMDWNTMSGDDKRRFCDQCGCHVHNLSALTASEQKHFAAKNGEKECITYVQFNDQTIAAHSWGDRIAAFFKPLRWALASILPFGFISCESRRTMGIICPQDSHIEKKVQSTKDGEMIAGRISMPNANHEEQSPNKSNP